MYQAIEKRQTKDKEVLLEQLRKTPIIQVACEKSGVGRATYYRWRQDDRGFAQKADESLIQGSLLVNDIAESQLMSAIRDKNLSAVIFWLRNHHPTYATKVEVYGQLKHEYKLSEEEIQELSNLLYNPNTFKKGQELLTSYVLRGKISESHAQLILRIFLAQMKVENVMTRKIEADVVSEVLFRTKMNKSRRR